jgi:predicted nucleic acid-binding protein
MKLVIDANILFAALIKDGLTAKLLINSNIKFYAPEYLLKEFLKYEAYILKKTKRSKQEFLEILKIYNQLITLIPKKEYDPYRFLAQGFCKDAQDIDYFCICLLLNCGLWSNEKLLKEQNKIEVYSTNDLIEKYKYYT